MAVKTVGRFRDSKTLGSFEVLADCRYRSESALRPFGQGAEAVEVVVDVVGHGHRRGGGRTGGVGRGLRRTPGFQQFAAGGVAGTGHQPLGTDLRGAADQTAVGNAIDAPISRILFGARYWVVFNVIYRTVQFRI